jgi:hypothetical protein
MKTIIYVISDMDAKLDSYNVNIINQLTELNFEDIENVTYQMLIDARRNSLNMAYGYPMYLDGVQFWVLPSLPMGLTIEEGSEVITEYTEEEYKRDILPNWDKEEEEIGL